MIYGRNRERGPYTEVGRLRTVKKRCAGAGVGGGETTDFFFLWATSARARTFSTDKKRRREVKCGGDGRGDRRTKNPTDSTFVQRVRARKR